MRGRQESVSALLYVFDFIPIPSINIILHVAEPNEIRAICLRLLTSVALRSGPADIVLSAITKKIEGENYEVPLDATAELEIHINSIYMTLDLKQLLTKNPVEEVGASAFVIVRDRCRSLIDAFLHCRVGVRYGRSIPYLKIWISVNLAKCL